MECHKLSAGTPAFRCLDCHTEIASRISAKKGLHASYDIKIDSRRACSRCHSEHNGEDFPLIKWDIKTFDHGKTGYILEGKHIGLSCDRCHTARHVAEGERATIKVKDLNKTFLGVSPACTTCHQDPHKNRLGPNCLQCHGFNDWKTASAGKFDHAKTRYPLTGLHAEVECQKCHTPGRDGQPRYTGIPFGNCLDCHNDPHRGGFEQTCQACHSTAGWRKLTASARNQSVDHSKTKFPLLGKHATVGCVQCHVGGDFKKPLPFQKCADCHKPDPHGGQFAKRADHGECAACHTVDGFKPAKFGLKEHAATAYPLEGKHAVVPCAQCHVPKGKDTLYQMKFQHCTDCHRDPHAGQFAGAPYFNNCERCHNLQRYFPSTFGLVQHKETRFPLTGGHVAVPCGDCHRQSADSQLKPAARYHWQNLTCTSCHSDPHRGQFTKRMQQAGPDGKIPGCELCHSSESWRELSRFDHSKTSYPLLGAHQTTRCLKCHRSSDPKTEPTLIDFKTAPTACEQCHENIHGTQFVKSGVTSCVECHNSTKWKPSVFDHDARTSFPLKGAHRKARCEACHKLTRTVAGRSVLFYKPTPKECSACHGTNAARQ